ncbi:hypothetical protein O9992_01485 [Vibrio lentus]|nr:hypothetical protein [Vibrio lentus]
MLFIGKSPDILMPRLMKSGYSILVIIGRVAVLYHIPCCFNGTEQNLIHQKHQAVVSIWYIVGLCSQHFSYTKWANPAYSLPNNSSLGDDVWWIGIFCIQLH